MPKLARDTKQRLMVPYIPRDGMWRTVTNGGTCTYDPGQAFKVKEYGSPDGFVMTCPPGRLSDGTNTSAWLQMSFYGEAVGIQLYRTYGTQAFDPVNLDVRVDGRMYSLTNLRSKWPDGYMANPEGVGFIMVDDELPATPDGRPHMIEIGLVGDPADQSTPATTLGTAMTTSTTGAITVGSTTGFPSSGVVLIDQELISYSAVPNSTSLTVSSRAQRLSTAQTHAIGATVRVSSVNIRRVRISGLMVDKVTGGYPEPGKYGFINNVVAVPTSLTAIPLASTTIGNDAPVRAITKIIYKNTAASATTITVNGYVDTDLAMWSCNLAAAGSSGDTQTLDFGRPVMPPGLATGTRFRHIAGASGVNFTVIGEA